MADLRINSGKIEAKSTALERIFKVTHQQISEYVKAGMPGSLRAWFPFEPCFVWWLDRKQAEIDRQLDNLDWKEQETRLKRAKADREEHELRILRGEYWKATDVIEQHGRLFAAFKSRVLAIGSNLAPRILACRTVIEAKKLIDGETWEALSELSRNTIVHEHDGVGDRSTAQADSKPVGRRKPRSKRRKRGRARKVENRSR